MATSQRFSSVSNSTSSSGFSSNNLENTAVHTNSDSNQHFSPNWATLSFLDDSNDELEDVEVTKVAKNAKSNTLNNFFDPVVGGRNSTRSSSSRSSAGSTGCSDQALESSPTNSLSPYAFVSTYIFFHFFWQKSGKLEFLLENPLVSRRTDQKFLNFFEKSGKFYLSFTKNRSQFFLICQLINSDQVSSSYAFVTT